MPKARPWPNNAARARDAAIMELTVAVRALRPLVHDEQFTRSEMQRRQSVALSAAQAALLELEKMK